MKRMVCEVCGGNDITKIDDTIFQCVSCGCKYTVEQARNLMRDIIDSDDVIVKARVEALLKKALMEIDMDHLVEARGTLNKALELMPNDVRLWTAMVAASDTRSEQSSKWLLRITQCYSDITQEELYVLLNISNNTRLFEFYVHFADVRRLEYILAHLSELRIDVPDAALSWALEREDMMLIKLLLEQRVDPNLALSFCVHKLVHVFPAKRLYIDSIKLLCEYGVDISSITQDLANDLLVSLYICKALYPARIDLNYRPSDHLSKEDLDELEHGLCDRLKLSVDEELYLAEMCLSAGADPNAFVIDRDGYEIPLRKHSRVSPEVKALLKKHRSKTRFKTSTKSRKEPEGDYYFLE